MMLPACSNQCCARIERKVCQSSAHVCAGQMAKRDIDVLLLNERSLDCGILPDIARLPHRAIHSFGQAKDDRQRDDQH